MDILGSVGVLFCYYITIAVGEMVEKCGLLDFDPRSVNIQALQPNTYYAYTDLPAPPCTNVNLNYVNFCYNFASPSSQPKTETVGQLYILEYRSEYEQTIRAYRPLQTDISSCEGSLFTNGGFAVCCISKSLNYDGFKITQGTATRTFGVRVPANTDHSIGLGYTDNQDYRVLGHQPSFIAMSVGSVVGESAPVRALPLPLISFTESATSNFQEEFCPSSTPSTEEIATTLAMTQNCTNPTSTTENLETTVGNPRSSAASTANAIGNVIDYNSIGTGEVPGITYPGNQQEFKDCSQYKTAVYFLATVSGILIVISTFLLVLSSWLIFTKKVNNKLDSERDTADLQPSNPAVHNMQHIERAQGDGEATKVPGCHSNNYDFLTYKRCRELTGNPEPLEGYDMLCTCAIAMGGNAAYRESSKTSRHGLKINTGEGLQDELDAHKGLEGTVGAIRMSDNIGYYEYQRRRCQEGSIQDSMMASSVTNYDVPTMYKHQAKKCHQEDSTEHNLVASSESNYDVPTLIPQRQLAKSHIPLSCQTSHDYLNDVHLLRSKSFDSTTALSCPSTAQPPQNSPVMKPGQHLSSSPKTAPDNSGKQKTLSVPESGTTGKTLSEASKSASMKSNPLYNTTMVPINQV